jgi:hypothetical protein
VWRSKSPTGFGTLQPTSAHSGCCPPTRPISQPTIYLDDEIMQSSARRSRFSAF